MRQVDMLITGGDVILGDPAAKQVVRRALAVQDGVIVAIGTDADLLSRFAADRVLDADQCIIFPGFVCTHTHLFQTVLKGLGRDRPLLQWLDDSVRRALRCYDRDAVSAAARLGLAQLVSSGVTTVVDYQYCHTEPMIDMAVIDAFIDLGVRGVLHSGRTDVSRYPNDIALNYRESEQQFLDQLGELESRYRDHRMVSIGAAPGIIWDMSKSGYEHLAERSRTSGMRLSMHCLETEDDDLYATEHLGSTTMEFLEHCGMLSDRFIAVHAVHLSDADFRIFTDHAVSVSHCPVSNMILASGAADICRMVQEGITVSLAVDGAASNDAQNMFEVLKCATLIQKMIHRDASVLPAAEVLSMATLKGARALGLDHLTGSIEEGKQADLCIYSTRDLYSAPVLDPIAALVYSSSPQSVRQTIAAGRVIYDRGELPGRDLGRIIARAGEAADRIRSQAEI